MPAQATRPHDPTSALWRARAANRCNSAPGGGNFTLTGQRRDVPWQAAHDPPPIAVAGVSAVGLSVIVAPASQYAVAVTNVGDAAATSSDDDPSSISIEGAGTGAVVSGAGLRCTPGDDEIDCVLDPALAVDPGQAVVANVSGVVPDATGDGAIFSVTADFNGSESSVDVATSPETYESSADPGPGSASGQAGSKQEPAAVARISPALQIHRSVRGHIATVTVAHAKGAAGTLTVTAKQGRARSPHGAGRAARELKVSRAKVAGRYRYRYRYRFTLRRGRYTITARWVGTGRWADQTQTRTYRAR